MSSRLRRGPADRSPVDLRVEVVGHAFEAAELDLWEEVMLCWDLPAVQKVRRKHHPGARRPLITVRRRPEYGEGQVSGCAHRGHPRRLHLSLGPGVIIRERLEELVLHEVIHVACPDTEHHGALYRRTLLRAARERWPGIEAPRNEGRTYDLDDRLIAAARSLRRKQAG